MRNVSAKIPIVSQSWPKNITVLNLVSSKSKPKPSTRTSASAPSAESKRRTVAELLSSNPPQTWEVQSDFQQIAAKFETTIQEMSALSEELLIPLPEKVTDNLPPAELLMPDIKEENVEPEPSTTTEVTCWSVDNGSFGEVVFSGTGSDPNLGTEIPRPAFYIGTEAMAGSLTGIEQTYDYSTPEVAELLCSDWMNLNLPFSVST